MSTRYRHASKLLHLAAGAKARSGTGYWRQLGDILRLRQAPNLLGPEEYFDFGLDAAHADPAWQSEFIGYKAELLYGRLNHPSWHVTANDKVVYDQVMRAAGFAVPRTVALFHPWRVLDAAGTQLRTTADLARFLAQCRHFPLFVKPVHGLFGRGTRQIAGFDAASGHVLLSGLAAEPLATFWRWLEEASRVGMLFQEVLTPSPEVAAVCGPRLSSIRMIVLCGPEGPSLFRANWKLSTGNNLVDNTEGWRNGNLVAAVDHDTGLIQRAFRGIDGAPVEVDRHPDTGAPLAGVQVPNWEAARRYAEAAAAVFPGLGFQGWDIAATTDGICGLEVNLVTQSTVRATQLVSRRGFLDARLRQALAALPDMRPVRNA